jgi:hypothetical protein
MQVSNPATRTFDVYRSFRLSALARSLVFVTCLSAFVFIVLVRMFGIFSGDASGTWTKWIPPAGAMQG